jgi:hypothetical protein
MPGRKHGFMIAVYLMKGRQRSTTRPALRHEVMAKVLLVGTDFSRRTRPTL